MIWGRSAVESSHQDVHGWRAALDETFGQLIDVAGSLRGSLRCGFEVLTGTKPRTNSSLGPTRPNREASYANSLSAIYDLASATMLPSDGQIAVLACTQTPPRSQQFTLGNSTLVLHDVRERCLLDYAAGIARSFTGAAQASGYALDHHLEQLQSATAIYCAAHYIQEVESTGATVNARLLGNFDASLRRWALNGIKETSPLREHFGRDFPGAALTSANDTLVAFHEIGHRSRNLEIDNSRLESGRAHIGLLLEVEEISDVLANIPGIVSTTSIPPAVAREAMTDLTALTALEDLFYPEDVGWAEATASVSAVSCIAFASTMAGILARRGGRVTSRDIEEVVAMSALRLGVGLQHTWKIVESLDDTEKGKALFHQYDAFRVWMSVVEHIATIASAALNGKLFPSVAVPGSSLEPSWWDDDERAYFNSEHDETDTSELKERCEAMLESMWTRQQILNIRSDAKDFESGAYGSSFELINWKEWRNE